MTHTGSEMRRKSLVALSIAKNEKDVENTYRGELSRCVSNSQCTSPYGTDGYATWKLPDGTEVRLLMEFKYDRDLKARVPLCEVLCQIIFYVKKFELDGEPLPNALLIADKNECLVISTAALKGFLDLNVDWTKAPSKCDSVLVRALVEGVNILPYVYDVGGDFDFRRVVDKIETFAKGEQHTVRATEQNLGNIFAYWRDRVFRSGRGKQALSSVEQVDVFLRCLFQLRDVYLHPTKRGVLVVPGYPLGVLVNADQYRSFFDHFAQGYAPSEVVRFLSMKDRLIEDDARRRQGAFFTPVLWVAEAHKELERVLGPNWRDECIVWDPAAGTGNLTRDYQFSDLISSTCERPDVNAMLGQGWGGKHVFQYDFLNPDAPSPFFEPGDGANVIPESVDKLLKEAAAAGKRLVFFMNPPYGTAVSGMNKETKKGIANTATKEEMKEAKMGRCGSQLYAQFMFRCSKVTEEYGFKNVTVGMFSPSSFAAGNSYLHFRDWWYGRYSYEGGFLFQSSHFADVGGNDPWGIAYTVWTTGETTDIRSDLPVHLRDVKDFSVVSVGSGIFYNPAGREASKWVREPIKGVKGCKDVPQFSSGLQPGKEGKFRALLGHLCYLQNMGNSKRYSPHGVYYMSPGCNRAAGFSVTTANWRRAVALYGARKAVEDTWDTGNHEYLAPDETLPGYAQWVDDCHIYATHRYNHCTAMREVEYKGKSWRIKNNFFWKTRKDALEALDTVKTHQIYRDCKTEPTKTSRVDPLTGSDETLPHELNGDPYLAHLLPTLNLSPDAQRVLDLLNALWLKSLPMREGYYESRPIAARKPDLHLTAWDAGVYQLKHLWRDLYPDDWKELQTAYKTLEEKLQEGVYVYGFLKK